MRRYWRVYLRKDCDSLTQKTYAGLTLFWKPGNVKAFGRGQEKVRKKAQSLRKVREFVQSGKFDGGNKTGVNCACTVMCVDTFSDHSTYLCTIRTVIHFS